MKKDSRIYVAGHSGMVGSAIVRMLKKQNFNNLILKTHNVLDLSKEDATEKFFKDYNPEYVINAAGKVGGINPNIKYPVEFLTENFLIYSNLLRFSNKFNVSKVIMIGSSCMYPRSAKYPFLENSILSGNPEPSNEGFALAKIAGMKLSQYYTKQYGLKTLNLIPCNLYGTNDHYDLENSHVLSALVKRFVDAAKLESDSVCLWGSGIPRREFMHVDDFAASVLFLINNWKSSEFINVGIGKDISIKELASVIINETQFSGKVLWDTTKPDGMLKKRIDISKLENLGFKGKISLTDGIKKTINEYINLK